MNADPAVPTLSKADVSNLRQLAVIFGLLGSVMLVGLLIPLTAIVQGARFLTGNIVLTDAEGIVKDARLTGWLFVLVGGAISIPATLFGGASVRLAWNLIRRRNHAQSISLAKALAPLGRLAFNVLARPTVVAAFNAPKPFAPEIPDDRNP